MKRKFIYQGLNICIYRQLCGDKGMQFLIRIEKDGLIGGYWNWKYTIKTAIFDFNCELKYDGTLPM